MLVHKNLLECRWEPFKILLELRVFNCDFEIISNKWYFSNMFSPQLHEKLYQDSFSDAQVKRSKSVWDVPIWPRSVHFCPNILIISCEPVPFRQFIYKQNRQSTPMYESRNMKFINEKVPLRSVSYVRSFYAHISYTCQGFLEKKCIFV